MTKNEDLSASAVDRVANTSHPSFSAEYSALIQKLNAFEAWSHHFISLYFVFLASLGAATGFVLYSSISETTFVDSTLWASLVGNVKTSSFPTLPSWTSQESLLQIFSSLGIGLNIWAVFMALEYERSSEIVLKQLSAVEAELSPLKCKTTRFATEILQSTRKGIWKLCARLTVSLFFLIIFVAWLLLLKSTF